MATIEQTCSQCSKTFNRGENFVKADIKRGRVLTFCDRECFKTHRRSFQVTVPCVQCGTLMKRTQSTSRGNIFCNRSCSASYNNAHKTTGTRRSKLEAWLETRLRDLYPDLDLHCNRKDAIQGELDFYFPSLKLAFELNGVFHYEPIFGAGQLARTQSNDARKWAACLERGIELCVVDTERFTYFKAKGAEKFLSIFQGVMDRAIRVRLAEGTDIRSIDPLRGRLTAPEPVAPKPLPFKAALALEKAIAWRQDVEQGMTHLAIAAREGCSQPHITRVLGLLRLPLDIQKGLLDRDPSYGHLQTKQAMGMVKLGAGVGFEPKHDLQVMSLAGTT